MSVKTPPHARAVYRCAPADPCTPGNVKTNAQRTRDRTRRVIYKSVNNKNGTYVTLQPMADTITTRSRTRFFNAPTDRLRAYDGGRTDDWSGAARGRVSNGSFSYRKDSGLGGEGGGGGGEISLCIDIDARTIYVRLTDWLNHIGEYFYTPI